MIWLNATPRAQGLWGAGAVFTLGAMGVSSCRQHRHLTAWLIGCVMGLAALMPTLSAWAMAKQAPLALTEVCSAKGARWVQALDPLAAQSDSGAAHAHGHCPFCVLQDHSPFVPAPQALVLVVSPMGSGLLPWLFLRAPRTLHAWSPLAARAPPASF